MKIVNICLGGLVTDGWSYQDNLLPKYQKINGYDTTIITSYFIYSPQNTIIKDNRHEYFNENNVKVIRLECIAGNFNYPFKKFDGLLEALEKESPDILFIHGVQFVDLKVIIKYLKKHPDVKVYADNHCDYINSASNWLSKNILHKIIWRRLAKKIEPYVSKFYGVLPARVDFLKDAYKLPKEKLDLLVMGADDEDVEKAKKPEIRNGIRNKYGIKDDDFLIISGGKIDSNKPQTLDLMKAMENIDDNIKLMVFGSVTPSLKEEFNKLLPNKNIIYIGWIPSTEVYKYFAAADLGVFPGIHSVLWEQAIGVGLPCVFRKMKSVDHVDLDGNCILLENPDVEALKNCINKIHNDKELYKKMKKTSEEKGMKEFSYRDIARRSIM